MRKTEDDVIFLCGFNSKVTAVTGYLFGERLAAMRAAKEHGEFTSWLKENFSYSRSMAYNYIGLYNFFKDETFTAGSLDNYNIYEYGFIGLESPDRNKSPIDRLLEYPSLNAALRAAGIIKNKKEESPKIDDESYDGIDLGDAGPLSEEFYKNLFEQPADSGLKSHRVTAGPTGIFIARRLAGGEITGQTALSFHPRGFLNQPPQGACVRLSHDDMMCEILDAVEKHLLSIEQHDAQSEKQLYDPREAKKEKTARRNRERKKLERGIKLEQAKSRRRGY
jgi:hypothetical protein